jgi:hypothetical protein
MLALARSGVCVSPKFTSNTLFEPSGAQAFIDRAAECHVDEHGGDFAVRPRFPQDLGQLAHQHTAIARVLTGDPDPRDRSGITTTAEGRNVPSRAITTDVHATDERIVAQAPRFGFLRFLNTLAADELELVGGRQPGPAKSIAILIHGHDRSRDEETAQPRVDFCRVDK